MLLIVWTKHREQLGTLAAVVTKRSVTFVVLATAVAAFSMLQSLIIPVLPEIQDRYDTSQSTVTWVLTAYLLSAAVCTPLVGRIGDAYGKQLMLAVALGALCLGSLLGAVAPSIGWLIAARVLQGVGGGVLPLAFGIARDELEDRMGLALAVLSSLLAVGYGLGIVVTGPILDGLGYHWLFWLPMLITGATTIATVAWVPRSRLRTGERLPVVPAVLLSAWLVALLVSINQGPQWGWGSPRSLALYAVAVVGALAWVRAELVVPVPLIDMVMMRRRGVWTANVVGAAVGFSMFASFGFLPQLLQTPPEAGYGFGASVSGSGFLILPSQIFAFFIGFMSGPLVRRLGTRVTIALGSLGVSLSLLSLAFLHDSYGEVVAATAVQGAGSGLVFATIAGVLVAAVPPQQTAVASGVNANLRSIGGAIGATVLGAVVTARVSADGFPAEAGYRWGFVMLAAVMLVAVMAAFAVPDRHQPTTTEPWQDAVDAELGLVPGAPVVPPAGPSAAV